jgi:hypothetical protein
LVKGAGRDGNGNSGEVIVAGEVEFEGDIEDGGRLAIEEVENATEGCTVEFAGVAYAATAAGLVGVGAMDCFLLRFFVTGAVMSVS